MNKVRPIYTTEDVKGIFALDKLTDLYVSLYGFALIEEQASITAWKNIVSSLERPEGSPTSLYFSSKPLEELRRHEDDLWQYHDILDRTKLDSFSRMVCNLELIITGKFEQLIKVDKIDLENKSLTSAEL